MPLILAASQTVDQSCLVFNLDLFQMDGFGLQLPRFSTMAIWVVEFWELFTGVPLGLWTSVAKEVKKKGKTLKIHKNLGREMCLTLQRWNPLETQWTRKLDRKKQKSKEAFEL